MEELNILEANEAKSNIQLHAITQIFCILLSIVLLSNPVFTRSAEDFFDLLLVPVAESGNAAYQKTSADAPNMEKVAENALKELDLRNPVIPGFDETHLLTEVAVATADRSLMLKDSLDQISEEMADAEKLPMLTMLEESNVLDLTPENPSGELEISETTVLDFIIPDTVPKNPLPGSTASEITASDITLQDSIISERPSDTGIQIDSKYPSGMDVQIDTKYPSGVQEDSKITISDVVQEPIQDSVEYDTIHAPIQDTVTDDTIQEPVVQETLPTEPQAPKENITDSMISEEPSNIPSTPELTAPDIADPIISDTTDSSGAETGAEENITETASCFLIDEAGMLFGFLPEYAEIQDSCLVLPSECTGIRSGTFSGVGAGIDELYIPAGVTMIESGAFIGLDSLVWIVVESPNPVYASINGVLFDSTTTVLVSFPAGRTDAYSLPSHVTQIADNAFANTSLSRLDFRRCSSLFLGGNIFGYSTGNGIVIAVPAESLPVYEDMLSAYAVTLTM